MVFPPPPSDISAGRGAKQPPSLIFLKYCKDVIGAQNMSIYFTFNIIFFSLLDSDWLKSVPINP